MGGADTGMKAELVGSSEPPVGCVQCPFQVALAEHHPADVKFASDISVLC